MSGISPAVIFGVLSAAIFLVYLIVWWATRRSSVVVKSLVRIVAAVALLAPLVWLAIEPMRVKQLVGEMAGTTPEPTESARAPQEKDQTWPKRRYYKRARPPEGGSSGSASPDGPRMRSASPQTPPKWDVVPVFYGTDRKREDDAQRIRYGSERSHQLELGRALVTVPKSHQVPLIERPWVYKLPFTSIVILQEKEDPTKHFTLKELKQLTPDQFVEFIRTRLAASNKYKDHALIFVHGFNTTFDFAIYRAAQLAYDLEFDGAPFVYSWPSRGTVTATAYSYDRESAGQAEPHLRTFIELVTARSGAKSVSIVAHSMGNQLLLPVLREINRSPPAGVKISQVILAAPDVDRDGFANLARRIQGVSQGVTLYAASNDRALTLSREFWGGVPRAGDVPSDGPVVVPGIDTIDVTNTSTEIFSLNHSGYAEKSALLKDIELLLIKGVRPPDARIKSLERINTSHGDYWKYMTAVVNK